MATDRLITIVLSTVDKFVPFRYNIIYTNRERQIFDLPRVPPVGRKQ